MARTRDYDGREMRRVLAAIIQDSVVCGRVSGVWRSEGLFAVGWANLAANLAIQYHRKYNTAPNGKYVHLFEDWADHTTADEKTIENIEKFLRIVSDESKTEGGDSEYLSELAGRHFNKVALEADMEWAKQELASGNVEDARARLRNAPSVNLGRGEYFEPIKDIELWFDPEEDTQRPLIFYREDLGKFIGDVMVRGTLFSFLGPDKVGKTTWLVDACYRAVRNRCRVAFFELGDGTKKTFMKRLGHRAIGNPQYAGDYKIPEEWDEDDVKHMIYRFESYDPIDGFTHLKKVGKNEDALRLSCFSNSSASIVDVDNALEKWSREEDWRPDVVVMDYADILAAPPGVRDPLEQVDETWKAMKRLTQDRNCLVLTATQSDSSAYNLGKGLLTKSNFSGRKTKNAHVDGIIGLNVTADEKSKGIARLNWVTCREGEANDQDFCRVAGHMAFGNPAMISKRR